MNSLVNELRATIRKRVDSAPASEILQIVSTLCGDISDPIAVPISAQVERPRFTKLGDDGEPLPSTASNWVAVHDLSTNLIWTRDNVAGGRMAWAKAKDAAAASILCDARDWRLPTIRELLSIVDYEKHQPAIDKTFFPSCESDWYWSATPYASSPADCAWGVAFYNGYAYWGYQYSHGGFVRAVRASQLIGVWPSSRK